MTPRPTDADALFDEGNALLAEGRFSDAIACYERALQRCPDHAAAHANLGMAHAESGRLESALGFYDTAIRLRPAFPEAHYNRGNALAALGRPADAVAAYEDALRHAPAMYQAWLNRGRALVKSGRLADAVASYRRALQLRPDYVEAFNNLGLALQYLGRVDEAIDHFDAALHLRPGWPDARCNRAQALLLKGDFRHGWPEYESRWQLTRCQLPPRPMPRWTGEPLAGRSVLLRAEQGAGDAFQLIRYAALVKQAGAGRVVVECPARLHPLLSTGKGVDEFTDRGGDDSDCDYQIPLLSLPGVFRTSFRTIPAAVPYLSADPERVERWKRLLPEARLRVGVAWQGNREFPEDHLRSIPLGAFAPLAKVPGVRLVSLQHGYGCEQIAAVKDQVPLHELGPDLDADGAFLDTAAVMMSLDLIVSCDTAIPHLAGALGRPVCLALAYSSEWRWLRDRDDSPWYPTARLFRQERPGDWSGPFATMAEVLSESFPREGI